MDLALAQQLLVSLALGMLVGLQRQRADSAFGGIRTFPLVTVFGTVCAQLAQVHGGWILATGLLALTALLVLSNVFRPRTPDGGGMTTEVAVLLLYGIGAFLASGPMILAVVLGGVVALLLHWKEALHQFVLRLGDADMRAIMVFVLISMVILPVLPNREFGPYGVFNPFEIWMMVVLIVGLSLGGYVAYKLLGSRGGVIVAGILGGLISSTATTVSSARLVRGESKGAALAALLIMIASTMAILRIVTVIGVVAATSFSALAYPLAALLGTMIAISAVAYFLSRDTDSELPEQENPAQLKPALVFAAIYALIKLAVAAAKDHFGAGGLYLVGVISGLTDVDAITLSTARLVDGADLDPSLGWRVILIAAVSNLAFKAGAAGVLGGARLFSHVAVLFGLSAVAGAAIFWLWPW